MEFIIEAVPGSNPTGGFAIMFLKNSTLIDDLPGKKKNEHSH